jgi:hypothetical protein
MTSSTLRRVSLSLLLLCASSSFNAARAQTATPTPQAPPPSPCKSRPEYRQFDFWVGEWDVRNPQGQQAGTNSVQLILGDCVVFENWTGARGGHGKSFNVYNAAKGKWQQTWVDNSGGVLELFGEYKDNQMRLTGERKGTDGSVTLQRLTFTKLADGGVRQLWDQSTDGGKTWTVAFDGTYVRKK